MIPATPVARPAAPPAPLVRSVLGHSVRGRPIRLIRVGPAHARVRVLVVGLIHGTEPAGLPIVARLEHARPPAGAALYLVPSMNPDGQAAGGRPNARGVDLNRNFPWHWRPNGPPFSTYYGGPRASSEPETRVMERLILRVRPQATVYYHQHLRLVYRQDGARPGLLSLYGRLVGLPVRRSPALGGTAIGWANRHVRGSTGWVVELRWGALPLGSVRRHAGAVLAVARGLARG